MTDSMVERVAAAIKARVPLDYGMTQAEAMDYARAAIEAIREPTEAMVDACQRHKFYGKPLSGLTLYRAMISAALKDTP